MRTRRVAIWLSLVVSLYLALPTAWARNPRRDVGFVEDPIGRGVTPIFPRVELNDPQAGRIAGPTNVPMAATAPAAVAPAEQLSLGPPVGAQVPFSPPRTDMPGAAFEPIPPDVRQQMRQQRLDNQVPAATQPALSMNPQPAPAQTPLAVPVPVAAAPVPMLLASAIPVTFSTPNTGSTFMPAGAVAPMEAAPPAVTTSVQSPMTAPAPTSAPGASTPIPANSFLSAESPANLSKFRLQPRINPATAPASASTQPPAAAPKKNAAATKPSSAVTDPLAELLNPPRPKAPPKTEPKPKENKLPPLDLPAPPGSDVVDPADPLVPLKPPGIK